MIKKRVLITGASRGIGKAVAEKLIDEGYEVYGTSRNPQSISKDNRVEGVHYLKLDLLNLKSIEEAIQEIDSIDILINNAGVSQIGPVEDLTLEQAKELFELNFFGSLRLIKAFLPGMREKGDGVIINISSMAARASVPYSSIYAATKAGIDAFSRCLQNEVYQYGVKVITVAPDYIKTTIPQKKNYKEESVYYESVIKVKEIRDKTIANGPEPEIIADKVLHVLNSKKPKPSYSVSNNAFLLKHLPEWLSMKFVRKKFKVQ